MKVVINDSQGFFRLSDAARVALGQKAIYLPFIPRNDEELVAVVQEFGWRASGEGADLRLREVPDGAAFYVVDSPHGPERLFFYNEATKKIEEAL